MSILRFFMRLARLLGFALLSSLLTISILGGMMYAASGPNGLFGDYFTNMISSSYSCSSNEVIVGYKETPVADYGKPKCTTFQNIVKSVFGGSSAPSGQALTGFDTDGRPQYGIVGQWTGTPPGNIYYTGANVGIGTNNPLYKLDVKGDVRASGNVEAKVFYDGNNPANFYVDPDGNSSMSGIYARKICLPNGASWDCRTSWKSTNGVCGTASASSVSSYPTGYSACAAGTQGTVDSTAADGSYNWNCNGSNGGSDASCNATKAASYTYSWTTSYYGSCSVSCGGGYQTRSVSCMRSDGITVSDSYCTITTKPPTSQSCNTHACTVIPTPTPITGSCGSANATTVSSYPTGYSACAAGTQGTVDSTASDGTYNWNCNGSNGGGNAGCYAMKPTAPVAVNGVCGSANNAKTYVFPTGGLCSAGNNTVVDTTGADGSYNWNCTGTNGGSTASCSAPRGAKWYCSTDGGSNPTGIPQSGSWGSITYGNQPAGTGNFKCSTFKWNESTGGYTVTHNSCGCTCKSSAAYSTSPSIGTTCTYNSWMSGGNNTTNCIHSCTYKY